MLYPEPLDPDRIDILLVEDSKTLGHAVCLWLRSVGYSVDHASCGREAIQVVAKNKPSVIITDLCLPDLDGYELIHELKKDPGLINSTFIALTGLKERRERQRALEAGFTHYITKPPDFDVLAGVIKQCFQKSNLPF